MKKIKNTGRRTPAPAPPQPELHQVVLTVVATVQITEFEGQPRATVVAAAPYIAPAIPFDLAYEVLHQGSQNLRALERQQRAQLEAQAAAKAAPEVLPK